jgi:hypothetical protein
VSARAAVSSLSKNRWAAVTVDLPRCPGLVPSILEVTGSNPSQTLPTNGLDHAEYCMRRGLGFSGRTNRATAAGVSDDLDWPDNTNRVHGTRYRRINERH